MPQQQRVIPLIYASGAQAVAVATGNNAAWICSCGYDHPLVGRSGVVSGPSPKLTVECVRCGKRYFVVPDGGNYKAAVRVEEQSSGDF